MQTYRKIDNDTLEITSNHSYLVKKEHLEEEKQMAERDKEETERRIEEIEVKLGVLKE